MKEITHEQFQQLYKPIMDTHQNTYQFHDAEDIGGIPIDQVWSITEEGGKQIIQTGNHPVNHIAYIVTRIPHSHNVVVVVPNARVSFNAVFDLEYSPDPDQMNRIDKMLRNSLTNAINHLYDTGTLTDDDYYEEDNPGIEYAGVEEGQFESEAQTE